MFPIKRLPLYLLLAFATLHLMPSSLNGAVIAQYEFISGSAASSVTYPDTTTGNFASGAGLSPTLTDGWIYTNASQTAADAPGAIAANDYFTFTLTPTNGKILNLTSLDFGTAFYADAGNNYDVYLFVRSSVDSYASDIGPTITINGQSNTTSPTFAPQSLNLTGAAFQNLSSAVSFRFYTYDGLTGATRYTALNNVVLNAIPEPSVSVLALMGIALFTTLRRKLK